MGTRSSEGRRIPGNPLGSVLRATARAARTPRRTVSVPGQTPDTEAGHQAPDTTFVRCVCPVVLSAVRDTDTDGQLTWFYGRTLDTVPVVSALVVSDEVAAVTILSVSPERVVLQVWDPYETAAGPGVLVHVMAVVSQ